MSSVANTSANNLVKFATHQRHLDRPILSRQDPVFTATHSIFNDLSEEDRVYQPLVDDLFNQVEFTPKQYPFIATFIATEHLDHALKVVKAIKNIPFDLRTRIRVLGKIAEKYIDIDPQQIERIVSEMLNWELGYEVNIRLKEKTFLKVLTKLSLTNFQLAKGIFNKLHKNLVKCNFPELYQKFQFQAAHQMASVNPKSTDAMSLLDDLVTHANTLPEKDKAKLLVDVAKELYLIDEEKSNQVWSEAIKVCEQITDPETKTETIKHIVEELVRCFPERVPEVINQQYDTVKTASSPDEKVSQILKFSKKYLDQFPQAQAIFICEEAVKLHSSYPDYTQGAIELLYYASDCCFDKFDDMSDGAGVLMEIFKQMAKLNPDKAVELTERLDEFEVPLFNDRDLFLLWIKLYLLYTKTKDQAFSIFEKHILFPDLELDYCTNYRIAKGAFQTFCQNNDKIHELALKSHQVCKTAILLEALDHCPNQKLRQYVTDKLVKKLNLPGAA